MTTIHFEIEETTLEGVQKDFEKTRPGEKFNEFLHIKRRNGGDPKYEDKYYIVRQLGYKINTYLKGGTICDAKDYTKLCY
jgi:hypothetical protein